MLKHFILIAILISWTSCTTKLSDDQKVILQITAQHFNDMVLSDKLLPIAEFDEWSKGRIKLQQYADGELISIPPTPPIDTVIYDLDFFDRLENKEIITTEEVKYFQSSFHDQQHTGIHLLPQDPRIKSSDDLSLKGHINPAYNLHYQISKPLFNKDKNKVILTIHSNVPGNSSGYRYVFIWQDKNWQSAYREQYFIE